MAYGTVELGGTKTLVAVGTTPDDLTDPVRIPTRSPDETLDRVADYLSGHPLEAVGVASFGPVELRRERPAYGSITTTPKPGWSDTPVVAVLAEAVGVPVGFDTDVNGAALGEGEWGAATGLNSYVYVTVGTGIGLGAVVEGKPLHGMVHPEFGHVVVKQHPDDSYAGRCPFHGDCLEGMATGVALADRFGPHDTWDDPEAAVELAVHYLAQGMRDATYAYAPQRIVVGGGVSKQPHFHSRLHTRLQEELAGYPGIADHTDPGYVCPPGLGDLSGLAGCLVLARQVLSADAP